MTNYIWDELSDTVLMETDGTGNTTAVYTNEPGQFGGLISERQGNQSQYYHYDGLGSTRQLTDGTGQVTDSRVYDAFGNTVQSTGSSVVPYHFVGRQGYYYDQELAEYYVRVRSYSAVLARWMSDDPFWGRENLLLSTLRQAYAFASSSQYAYVGGRPVTNADPSGFQAVPIGGVKCTKKICEACKTKMWEDPILKEIKSKLTIPVLGTWKIGCKPNIVCCDKKFGQAKPCDKCFHGSNSLGEQYTNNDIGLCARIFGIYRTRRGRSTTLVSRSTRRCGTSLFICTIGA